MQIGSADESTANVGNPERPRFIGADRALRLLQSLGLVGFLGGLAALSAMHFVGPQPDGIDQWRMMIGLMRAVFYPCVFSGIIALVISGSALWWRHRRQLHGVRWFKLMMIMLAIAVPGFHLWARTTMLKLDASVRASQLDLAQASWHELGQAYAIALVVMLVITAIGIIRPRLGQR